MHNTYSELVLHARSAVHVRPHDLLEMQVELPSRDLGRAGLRSVQHGIVDEDVLVVRLHHVRPLRPQRLNAAVDVDGRLELQSVQHAVDRDERTRTANASARQVTLRTNAADTAQTCSV